MNKKLYYLGFSLFPGIGPMLFEKLVRRFGSAEHAWKRKKRDLGKVLGEITLEKFFAFREMVDLEKELQNVIQKDIQLITITDEKYPQLLKKIPHPPFLLYLKGDVSVLSSPKILGIVGTRKITPYGKQVTEMITADLVGYGFITVSGLALGVDAAAHIATIKNGGKTIAVLGCGVDCCYPRENQKIYDSILESGGAIVSTFPVSMDANKGTFPARNAIIAGLSQGILVTEGAADSGSLITASYAKRFDRPVFAVPGPITSSLSQGANRLIKNGAISVMSSADILDNLGIIENLKSHKSKRTSIKGTKEEQAILSLLETGPLHFDEIVRRIEKDSKTTGSLLSLMELKGIVKSNGGMYSI